jgi:hypothetical protein
MPDNDNVILLDQRRVERDRAQQEENEHQMRDGERILKHKDPKLSIRDREILARNLGYALRNHGITRKTLARQCALDPKELYRRLLGSGEEPAKNRLRAGFLAYKKLIEELAKCANIDKRLLASRIAYGTALHPSSGPVRSEIEWIKRRLYDLAEGMDAEFRLTERFAALAEVKRMLAQDRSFACWPNGGSGNEEFHRGFWSDVVPGDMIVGYTSLLAFLRFVPHAFIGIRENFDDGWPIPENLPGVISGPWGPSLQQHPDCAALQALNRRRLAEVVGDVSRLVLDWDEDGECLSINGTPEHAYLDTNWSHLEEFLCDVGLPTDRARYGGEVAYEHSIWICFYPSRQTVPGSGSVPNLIPVIVQNYGSGGASGDITVEKADSWLDYSGGERLISGLTAGDRLLNALSVPNESVEPELKAELRRTALFIEHHPLLVRYRQQQAGEKHIRAWREELARSL